MSGESRVFGRVATSLWVVRLALRSAPGLTITMAVCTLLAGVLPAVAAYVGKWIVDDVVTALALGDAGWGAYRERLWGLVALEAGVMSLLLAANRGHTAVQGILRTHLANRVVDTILEKALTLDLSHFEDPDIHDRLMRARRDAASRPFNLVSGFFTVVRNLVTLGSCIVLLLGLSWWAVLIVVIAGLPAFIAELRFSHQVFDHQRKRTPEQREQAYLEGVLSREDFAKEVKLYDLARPLLEKFRAIARKIEGEERAIHVRRNTWGFVFNLLGTLAFYMAYAWIVRRTVNERLTLGEMTMYLVIFRQAQQGVTAGLASLGLMLDDHLYMRDLHAFLAMPVQPMTGTATSGPDPSAGLALEHVSFRYPDARRDALDDVSFTIRPGEMVALVGQNGSGKTTLLKLITRLYEPTSGRILLDGLDVREWDVRALRRRFALVFQDFVRFKMKAGENIGAGDVDRWHDEDAWEEAGKRGLAHPFVVDLPDGYHTQLGKWFRGGQELSGGQWQKIALSRAFMRDDDPILVLDEPTAALDPDAEIRIFEHVQASRGHQPVLLISHRFGSVRMADDIVVLDRGRVIERGAHEELVAAHGLYARLFDLQAAGYVGRTGRTSDPAGATTRSSEDDAL